MDRIPVVASNHDLKEGDIHPNEFGYNLLQFTTAQARLRNSAQRLDHISSGTERPPIG
jgi:hypothetical protein